MSDQESKGHRSGSGQGFEGGQDVHTGQAAEPVEKSPSADAPVHLRDRLRSIADRLHGLADDLGGELMVDLPSRLGDHKGLIIALANELEQLVK